MGAIWLLSMPDVLRAAGLEVDVYPGWQTRSRSSGGYDAVHGVQVHHTASNASPANDMAYMWLNAAVKPIGAIYLARDGRVTVGAAGATNTSGRGGPLGPIPLDQANKYVISIEAANAGNGEPWPQVQQMAYLKLVNALVKAYGLDFKIPGVHAHHEWTSRKIDPAGPSKWATGANKWNMNSFRLDAALVYAPDPIPPLKGATDMFKPIMPHRNSDTRGFGGPGLLPANHQLGLNSAIFPANVVAITGTVTMINPASAGFMTVWPGGPRPDTSCLNFPGGPGAVATGFTIGVNGLAGFQLFNSVQGHFIVDITGYWTP